MTLRREVYFRLYLMDKFKVFQCYLSESELRVSMLTAQAMLKLLLVLQVVTYVSVTSFTMSIQAAV